MSSKAAIEGIETGPGKPQWLPRALFFGSGAVALAAELLWLRRFTTLLGATAAATAATLAGVFLGFAVGSFLAGRFARRVRRPLRAYGLLELAAAAAALALLPLLSAADALLPKLRLALESSPGTGRAIEALLTSLLVLAPTACLGATLPVLAPALGRDGGRALYAANAFGAVAGCLAVPWLLLPAFGVERSYFVVVGVGAAIGVCAWLVDRRSAASARDEPPRVAKAATTPPDPAAASRAPASDRALAFVSGLVLLGLEAAYARLFAQVHESSLHAFAIVVAAFLLALALGTGLARAMLRLSIDRKKALALAWSGAGLLIAAVPLLFDEATGGLEVLAGRGSERGATLLGIAALVLIPAVALGGAALPLLLGRAGEVAHARELGGVLGWNTLGSIAGPMIATFVAFPTVGLFGTFSVAGGALVVIAAVVAIPRAPRSRRIVIGAGYALVGATVVALSMRPIARVRLDPRNHEELVELREGPLGIAAVIRSHDLACIKLDNHYTLGGTRALGDQRQLGHLPLLLHPQPKSVAFLGLGTGITAGAALQHPVTELVAVELVPEVAELARLHFADANLGLLGGSDPRVKVVADDARPFLRGREGRFDVIVGDLVVPWRAGESALYTAEHFAQARAALAPAGLFCQWLPAYQLTVEQFDAIAATFLDVFPRATLWRGDFFANLPTLALVGHLADVDPARVADRVRALVPKLDAASPYLMHPAGPWLFLIGPLDPASPRFRAARRHSRSFPWLELAGPSHGERGSPPLLTGPPLDQLFAETLAAPLAGGPLAALGPDEQAWRSAGMDLWRASALAMNGEGPKARELGLATLARLPSEIRTAVLGSGH